MPPTRRFDIPYWHVFFLSMFATLVVPFSLWYIVKLTLYPPSAHASNPQEDDELSPWAQAVVVALYLAASVAVFSLIMGYI
ncbi:MAG: hypothetical protein AAF495_13980 [Pseudomonadota bacterium]